MSHTKACRLTFQQLLYATNLTNYRCMIMSLLMVESLCRLLLVSINSSGNTC